MLDRAIRSLHLLVAALALCVGCAKPPEPERPPPPPPPPMLELASTSWPPFTGEEGRARVALDLVETALERAGYRSHTSIMEMNALLDALKAGKFDGSGALWLSDDRKEYLLYSRPYLENRLVLVGRKGSPVSAASFGDLVDKRVGVVEGYAYGPELDSATEPTFVRLKDTPEMFRALLAEEVDYLLLDALLVEYVFQAYPDKAQQRLEVGRNPLLKRSLHFAVRKNLRNARLIIAEFNAGLKDMVRDGSYHVALQLSWISADADGDGRKELVSTGDTVGPAPPTHSYTLFEEAQQPRAEAPPPESRRYFVGGRVYESWDDIPDSMKLRESKDTVGGGHPAVNVVEW